MNTQQKQSWGKIRTKKQLKKFYLSLLPELREVAKKSGYALGVHGSLERDFDLIAVAWGKKYVLPTTLAKRLQFKVCGLKNKKIEWENKPNGRIACILVISMNGYIDLSVITNNGTIE